MLKYCSCTEVNILKLHALLTRYDLTTFEPFKQMPKKCHTLILIVMNYIFCTKRLKFDVFVQFSFLGLVEIRHMVYISILTLNGCFISNNGPLDLLCKMQGMIHVHVLECFARA